MCKYLRSVFIPLVIIVTQINPPTSKPALTTMKKTHPIIYFLNFLLLSFGVIICFFSIQARGNTGGLSVSKFYHGFSHCMEKSANEYLMEEINMHKYSEWQSPPITYWGPSSNNQEAKITYKYAFDGKVTYARARIPLAAFNFGASSGGSSSAWASKDGENWERLLDNPYPANIDSYKTYEDSLPASLLGGNELYVQVRMEVFGSPNSSFTLAQFSRSSTKASKDLYYVDVEYSKASVFVNDNEKPKEVSTETVATGLSPRPNTFVIRSIQAGSTTDVDNLTVTDLDLGEVVYENQFSATRDAADNLILHYYPVSYKQGNNFETNGVMTRVVGEKLRLETTGFGRNGSGGYNSVAEASYTGNLPKNFLIEFDAKRMQWAGHFGFYVFYQDPSDTVAHYADGGYFSSSRKSELKKLIFRMNTEGSWFNEYGVTLTDEGWLHKFSAPSKNPLSTHRFGIGLKDSIVSFYLNGDLLNEGDISGFLAEPVENKTTKDTDEGLLAYFPFDGDAQDYSGNENHGTNVGLNLTTDRFTKANQAYEFTGNNYMTVQGDSGLNAKSSVTISAWISPADQNFPKVTHWYEKMWIVGKNRDITSGYHLFIGEGNTLQGWAQGNEGLSKVSFMLPESQGKWSHCLFSYDKDHGGALFFDGKKVGSSNSVGSLICKDETEGFSIGRLTTFNLFHFQGKIDDVRIYNRALTEVEIVSLYEADLSGRGAPAMPEPGEVPGGFVNYITLLGEVNGKVQKAEKELGELMKEGEEKAQKIGDLEVELSRLNQELGRVEGELKSCEEEGDRTREQIKEVERLTLSRELEIIGLEGQVDGVQARLDATHCEHLKVGERLEFLKEEMSGYADKLKTAHTPGWHYVPGYGWLWTSPEHYPQVYSNARNGWLYYEPGTSEPWLYYDYTLEQWEEWFVDPALFSLNN